MAILKKRTSNKQIPDAKALNRAPLSSVINGVGNAPNVSGGSPNSITSSGGSKPSLTTNTGSGTGTTTSSKPSITNNSSSGTKPSLTTNTTGVPRNTLTSATRPSNSNSITNKVVNALTGAALGAGTKFLIDKISGKPKVVPNTSGAKPPVGNGTVPISGGNPPSTKPITSVVTPPAELTDQDNADETNRLIARAKASQDSKDTIPETDFFPEFSAPLDNGLDSVLPTQDEISAAINPVVAPPIESEDSVAPLIETAVDAAPPTETEDIQEDTEPQYFQDDDGNVYVMNADGSYSLYLSIFNDDTTVDNPIVADETYTDPETGAVFRLDADGNWTTDYVDNTVYPDEYETYEVDDFGDYPNYADFFAKRGGLITMMNKGGVANYAVGGDISQYNDLGNGTYSYYDSNGDYVVVDNMSGDEISRTGEDGYQVQTQPTNYSMAGEVNDVGTVPSSDQIRSMVERTPTATPAPSTGILNTIKDLIGADNYDTLVGALPAAGAGAFVASLLGSNSGGGGGLNQGVDMSKVGVINPRTTDFGIGPTNFVGYDDYGTSGGSYTPNEELLRNLNAPGFNPVREGDYGYEEDASIEETPKMASGGLSSMATPVASYYTFGQPADILANLGMRAQPPMNSPDMMNQIGQQQKTQPSQQQGLPQQSPVQMMQQTPQGMPQQGTPQNGMMPQQQGMAPPMRKGGLPHASDVPMTQGRMDFRQGAAVHGAGDGQSDDIPAMLADGEYVIDAETVAQIGNGSTKAGAQALDKFREGIRAHKRAAPLNKIPPKTKPLTSYLKGAK